VAAIFAFVALGIELCVCYRDDERREKKASESRLAANCCAGILVANMFWMAWTGSQTLKDQVDAVESYSMINRCSDSTTILPVESL